MRKVTRTVSAMSGAKRNGIRGLAALSLLILVATLLLSEFGAAAPPPSGGYIIEGDCVKWQNIKGMIQVCPHTISQSGLVNLTITSNISSAISLDYAVGFSTDDIVPLQAQMWKNISHNVTKHNESFTYGNITAWNETTGQWQNISTINHTSNYYAVTEWFFDWVTVKNRNFDTVNYAGKKWYYGNATWDAYETKTLRIWIETKPFSGSEKYEMFLKPSILSFEDATTSGNYVLLDPWVDTPPTHYIQQFTYNDNTNKLGNVNVNSSYTKQTINYPILSLYNVLLPNATNLTQDNFTGGLDTTTRWTSYISDGSVASVSYDNGNVKIYSGDSAAISGGCLRTKQNYSANSPLIIKFRINHSSSGNGGYFSHIGFMASEGKVVDNSFPCIQTAYLVVINDIDNYAKIYKEISNTQTELASTTWSGFSDQFVNYTIIYDATSDTIKLYNSSRFDIPDNLIVSVTDSSINAAGFVVFGAGGGSSVQQTSWFDDIEILQDIKNTTIATTALNDTATIDSATLNLNLTINKSTNFLIELCDGKYGNCVVTSNGTKVDFSPDIAGISAKIHWNFTELNTTELWGYNISIVATPSSATSVPLVNVSISNSTSASSTASLASEQLFSNVNFSDADLHQEVNSTFRWYTNQSWGVGNRTAELVPMIYRGAVGYWHLDESGGTNGYADSSGQGNTGTPAGGVANVSGIIRGAASFDGTDDAINMSDIPAVITKNLTILAWIINKDFVGTGSTRPIVGKYKGGTADRSFYLASGGTSGFPRFEFQVRAAGEINLVSNQNLVDNRWYHVAATYNGANLSIYVDGEFSNATAAFNGNIVDSTEPFYVGRTGDNSFMKGAIDEVAIYNRSLSASEIKQIYLRTWYDYSPQLFLLQPYKDNATGLNSSDNEAPITVAGAKNVSGVWDGTYGVNLTPNGYINYSNNNSQNFNEKEGMVEFWVKPEWNGNDNLAHVLFDTENAADFNITKTTTNDLAVYFGNPGSALVKSSISGWTSGTWRHVAVAWNSNISNVTLHIDGSQVNNSGTAFAIPFPKSYLIGARAPGTSDWANATFSEFRISRKALTQQELNYSFSKSRAFFQNEYMFNSSNFAAGDTLKLEYSPKDSTGTSGDARNSSNLNVHAPKTADEAEGDTAIEVGINSSLPSATKYKEQQVYIRNLSNNQTLGKFDWQASFGNQRWLLNYITTGESYVRAPNLTTAVYVLEITDKTSAAITDEVSKLINATKTQ